MVVDCILDRKDGSPYNPREFYHDMLAYEADDISRAMDEGTEEDVKKALCDYIKFNDYNPAICDYINSVNWLASSNRRIKMDKKPVKSSEDKEKYWGAFGEDGCVEFLTREEFIDQFGEEPKDEDALDYVDSGCHGKDKKDKKKKPVKSSMPGKEKGIQAIMDEYGCTREEAIEIINEEIQNSRKPVKSSFAGFDDFDSFASYAEAHYLPVLDKVSEEGYQITRDDARLLSFLHDDLVSLVNNGFDL